MSRTTLDIEATILKEVREIQRREGGSLGSVISRLVADALARRKAEGGGAPVFRWTSRRMGALVDLGDKESVYAILDRADRAAEP